MNDKLQKFLHSLNASRRVNLSDSERASIRLALVREMEKSHQARLATVTALWLRSWRPALIAAALVLSLTGVSLASESALPGDLLYPVKLALNERIRAGLARTPAERVSWALTQLARRLDEAERLAQSMRLDEARQAQVIAGIRLALSSVNRNRLEDEDEKSRSAERSAEGEAKVKRETEALERLTMTLQSHQAVLATLASKKTDPLVLARFDSNPDDKETLARPKLPSATQANPSASAKNPPESGVGRAEKEKLREVLTLIASQQVLMDIATTSTSTPQAASPSPLEDWSSPEQVGKTKKIDLPVLPPVPGPGWPVSLPRRIDQPGL